MSYIRKSLTNVLAAVTGVILLAAIAIWQFYLFVIFKNAEGLFDAQGALLHLSLAIGVALMAYLAGFFVFSVFLRYDKNVPRHMASSAVRIKS